MKRVRFTIPNDYEGKLGNEELAAWMHEHVGEGWDESDIWSILNSRLPNEAVFVAMDDFSTTYVVPDDWQPDNLPPLWVTFLEEEEA